MSPILSALLLVAAIAHANPNPTVATNEICTRDSECAPNNCCRLMPGKYATPICTARQQKDEQCRPGAQTITTNLTYPNSQLEVKDIHFILCPCADGLSCNPKIGGICD